MKASSPLSVISLLSVAFAPCASAEPKPLAEAAVIVASKMPRGCIVTAEQKGGSISYALAGKSDTKDTPPEKIEFEIGSVTKVFTALLLAQAVTEGKTKLDATLREVMGTGQKFADSRVGAITLRQLATHTSGLPRLPDNMDLAANPDDPYANYYRAMLDEFISRFKLTGEPPFERSYSNLGVGLLGDILSRLYDKPWDALIAEKITGPLGMRDTTMTLSDEQGKRLALPWSGKEKAHSWHDKALAGCGALRSTAADMILFGNALLHPDKTPLKEAIAMIKQPQAFDEGIGLALMISRSQDGLLYWHNGGTGGYRTLFEAIPATDSVHVVLVNNAAFNGEAIMAVSRNEKPRTEESGKIISAEKLAEYEGVYALGGEARFTILRRGDQLWTQLTGQSFLRLFPHEKDDRFFLKVVAAEMQFNRENGKIVSVTNFQNERSSTARKTDDPVPKIKFRSAKELAAYAGTYQLAPKMIFTLKVVNATLFAQLTGQPFVPVFEKRDDWFEYDVVAAALEFERNKDGKITALKLHQNGIAQRAVKKP